MVSIWGAIGLLIVGFTMGLFCISCFVVAGSQGKRKGGDDPNV